MSDYTLHLCKKIEKSFLMGNPCHNLSPLESSYMEKHSHDVISFLSDFDGIKCRYFSEDNKVVFK